MRFQLRDVFLFTLVAALAALVVTQHRSHEAKRAELQTLASQEVEASKSLSRLRQRAASLANRRFFYEQLETANKDIVSEFDRVVEKYSEVPVVEGQVAFRCLPSFDSEPNASSLRWKIVVSESAAPIFLRWAVSSNEIPYEVQQALDTADWSEAVALSHQGRYEVELPVGVHEVELTSVSGGRVPVVQLEVNGRRTFTNDFLGPGEISGSMRPTAATPIARNLSSRTQYLATLNLGLSQTSKYRGWLWLSAKAEISGFQSFPEVNRGELIGEDDER